MPEARTLTCGSLFSGIGGLDLGLERAGFDVRWQVEIDDYCRRVLTKHWPDVPKYGDIKELSGYELERVDLIAGGFPCQPVSLAGEGLAQADARWLWPEFARIVRVVRPRFVLVENVPGLLSRGFGDVLGDLAACGYDTEWDCIPAAAVGAPHLRDRVWLVAYADEFGRDRRGGTPGEGRRLEPENSDSAEADADAHRQWELQPERIFTESGQRLSDSGCWSIEPDVARMVHGLSGRVDRVRGLGNAVVPQVAQFIGERIVAYSAQAVMPLEAS